MTALLTAPRSSRRFTAGIAVVVALLFAACTPEQNEAYTYVNGTRSTEGLAALNWDDPLAEVAQRHAEQMAGESRLFHSSLSAPTTGCLSENVGVGPSIAAVHANFLGSATHRASILNAGTDRIGVGVAQNAGKVWVVLLFSTPC